MSCDYLRAGWAHVVISRESDNDHYRNDRGSFFNLIARMMLRNGGHLPDTGGNVSIEEQLAMFLQYHWA